jgi:hypothetical protein
MNAEMLASVSERRRSDPLTCLLMWLLALNADPVREALRLLEVSLDEIYNMFSGLEYEQAQMRRLRMVCELTGREQLGKLMRGRLTEMLMQCTKATDIAALIKAGVLLPDWVLDERPDVVHVVDELGRPFARPDIEARAAAQALADAGYEVDAEPGMARAGNGTANTDVAEDGNGAYGTSPNGDGAAGNGESPTGDATAESTPIEDAVIAGALNELLAQQPGNSAGKVKNGKAKLPRRR